MRDRGFGHTNTPPPKGRPRAIGIKLESVSPILLVSAATRNDVDLLGWLFTSR